MATINKLLAASENHCYMKVQLIIYVGVVEGGQADTLCVWFRYMINNRAENTTVGSL